MSIVGFATYLTSDSNYSLHGSKQELLRCLTTTQHRWGAKMHVAHHVGHQSIGNYPFAWFACCTLSIVVMWCASRILMIQIHISNHIQSYPYVCRWNEWNGKPASPCQAPTGTVDLLSGGEATVTPVPTPAPEVTKVTEAASFVQMEEVYRWFMAENL